MNPNQTKLNERIEKGGMLYREAVLEIPADADDRRVNLVFSTEEAEVERWFGIEQLGHETDEVDMSRLESGSAPLLMDHNWRDVVGVIEKAEITDRKGRAVVRFGKSARAEEVFQDVKDKIRMNVSVGYFVNRVELVTMGGDDEPNVYRVTDWQPFEISIVSVPADVGAGIDRNAGKDGDREIVFIEPSTNQRGNKMDPNEINENGAPSQTRSAPQAPAQPASPSVDTRQIEDKARRDELQRIRGIQALIDTHVEDAPSIRDAGQSFINDGKSVGDFQRVVLEALAKSDASSVTRADDSPEIGLSEAEADGFSILRAVNAVVNNNRDLAPFEMEVIEATRKKFSERTFRGNIQLPVEVLNSRSREMVKAAQRDLTAGGSGTGAELVGTLHDAANFIDLLRGRLLTVQAGARVISGLVGNLAIPKLTGGATAYWVTEGSDVTESTPTTGQVTLQPKTVGATVDLSRRILLQSSPDAEALVRDDMAKVLALKIDEAAYNGDGSGGAPTGIINTTGVGTVDYGAGFTWGDIVDLETQVAIDNALMGSLHYITTPSVAGTLKQTLKASGVAGYIWNNMVGQPGVGEMNGYSAHTTTLMPADRAIFGNFSDLLIGEWGVLDIIVDTASLSKQGGVRLVALQDVDIAVRHPESFSYAFT